MNIIINGNCILPDSNDNFFIAKNQSIIFNDKILSVIPTNEVNISDFENIIDAKDMFVSPGFINIHIHGCAGFDTMDNDDNALHQMQKFLPSTGVTSFLPTTMTMPMSQIYNSFNRIKNNINNNMGAKILGVNVEGPFINKKYKGAQDEKNIKIANFDYISNFFDIIKIITVAPEFFRDFDFVNKCHEKGIIVSIGHSAANYDTAINAINVHKIKHITHLFNAQTGLHHRNPGIVGAALDTDAIVEIIADNVHVHPAAQRLVYKSKKHNEIILITDSLRACGLGDGTYDLGGQEVFVKGELATLSDGTIAASVASMNKVVNNFKNNTNIDIAAVVELVTKNPAKELKLYNNIGSIEIGKSADIIVFDENINIKTTIVDGKIKYNSNN